LTLTHLVTVVVQRCSNNGSYPTTLLRHKQQQRASTGSPSQHADRSYIHGPCRRFRSHHNDEGTRTFCGKFLYNAIASTDNAQHKNCPSSGMDDRLGRDLFRVLKRSPILKPHTLRLRRGYSDGKAVGNMTGLRRRLHPHWRISLLQSLCRALGQTEASSNF